MNYARCTTSLTSFHFLVIVLYLTIKKTNESVDLYEFLK